MKAKLIHPCHQLIQIVLPLAAADDFSDAGNKTVNCGNRLVVRVHLHIEGLDFLWIIGYEYRLFEHLFSQIALMLCLKVAAPGYLVVKLVIVLLKQLHCIRVSNMAEF